MKLPNWIARVLYLLGVWRKQEIALIADSDLKQILSTLDLINSFDSGLLSCSRCGKTLDDESLAGFTIQEGEYAFICDDIACLGKVNAGE